MEKETFDKKGYLEDPTNCPFCNGTDLSLVSDKFYGEGELGDPKKIFTMMECENCGKSWFDIYKLVDIETVPEVL